MGDATPLEDERRLEEQERDYYERQIDAVFKEAIEEAKEEVK